MSERQNTALVTGGSKRVGLAICLALASRGYAIAVHCHRSRRAASELIAELKSVGVRASCFKANLANAEEIPPLVQKVSQSLGPLSLLVNNASVFDKAAFFETSPALLDQEFAVNFQAPFLLTQAFARHCKKGLVINLLDTRITGCDIDYFAYTLSKKTLADFTLLAARALAPGIRVNGIAPGLLLPPEGKGVSYLRGRVKKTPLRRKPQMAEIIGALHYFLDNPAVTGQILHINSGEHLAR